jgi:F subunit of K+-transporting ATPase (Potass_KdpF)
MSALGVIVVATFSGADAFGLLVAAIVCVYLLYALLRGEKL